MQPPFIKANFLSILLFFCYIIFESHHELNILKGVIMIDHLYELIQSCYPLEYFEYAKDGHLIRSNSSNAKILDTIFSHGGMKDYMINHADKYSKPVVLSSSLGNIWICIYNHNSYAEAYYVLGPVFTENISITQLQQQATQYTELPLFWKKKFMTLVQNFPVIPWTIMTQYAIMLHYAVNKEKIKVSDFHYQSQKFLEEKQISSSQLEIPSSADEKLTWNTEQQLLAPIREGNPNYQSALASAQTISSGVRIDIGNPLRRAKDSGIIFATLCCRAAIEGGLYSRTAYTVQDMYTQSLEAATSLSDVATINHQMYEDYIYRVHKAKNTTRYSPQIQMCIEHIDMHLIEPLSISDLASLCGYTDYYLSRKFKKEVGKNINVYINEKKIGLAKSMLSSSNISIQEISDELNFCSRSYFTDVFRKICGISPTQYREEHLHL